MSNVLAFPARTSRYINPPSPWATYRVHAIDASGTRIALEYRALSMDSAYCRARRDGYVHVESVEKVSDA